MNATSFDALMQKEIETLGGKKRLLLHCCCAPCSSACLERLAPHFEITAFFYNPNIEDGEYEKRKAELIRFITETRLAAFIDCDHDGSEYFKAVQGLENEREGGARCEKCFALRLEKTARTADEYDFDYFTTTLTISPLKNAAKINEIGKNAEKKAKWLYSDFKKRGGYQRSIQLSKEFNLYRQNYCGCVFSKNSTLKQN